MARRRQAVALGRRRGVDTLDRHVETETGAAALLAGHLEDAAHGLGDALDEDEAEAGAAVTARDRLARLREGAKEIFQRARVDADAAVR